MAWPCRLHTRLGYRVGRAGPCARTEGTGPTACLVELAPTDGLHPVGGVSCRARAPVMAPRQDGSAAGRCTRVSERSLKANQMDERYRASSRDELTMVRLCSRSTRAAIRRSPHRSDLRRPGARRKSGLLL